MLEPSHLRRLVALPWDEMREEFIPRFLSTNSYNEFILEVGRFVATSKERWLSTNEKWPADRAKSDVRQLLDETIGVEAAMRAVRHGDQGGMRHVLDTLAKELQAQALTQYLEHRVLPAIHSLKAYDSMTLAEAYLREFKSLGIEVEHPAPIAAKWRRVLKQHARSTL